MMYNISRSLLRENERKMDKTNFTCLRISRKFRGLIVGRRPFNRRRRKSVLIEERDTRESWNDET